MKRRKAKSRLIISLILLNMFLIILLIGLFYNGSKVKITDQYIKGDDLYLVFADKVSCSISKDEWIGSDENNACIIPLSTDLDDLKIKNTKGFIYKNYSDIDSALLNDVAIDDSPIYLAIYGSEYIDYSVDEDNVKISFSSDDESIAEVNENGKVSGLSEGQTTVEARIGNIAVEIDVIVTDLIDPVKAEFDYSKPFLSPGLYSEEDNDLLDEIMFSRIEKAGYQTRAGAVAAARFLALEFPYRIHYFTENGRLISYIGHFCDGEGRYYHKGLYLHESRYANLDPELILDMPAVWGGKLYEYTNERFWPNGLDCSGFVSWALLQAGYDPGDLGAGIAEWEDLSDLGPKTWLESSLDDVRTGDLLAGGADPIEGGHIAMVVGLKDGYFYIAESQETSEYYWGYCIRKYSAEELTQYFFWRVDMTEFYGEDGNLTDYWLNY